MKHKVEIAKFLLVLHSENCEPSQSPDPCSDHSFVSLAENVFSL